MRKKYISIAIIIALIGIFDFFEEVSGSVMWNLTSFNSDKQSYYIDEEIKINASWELNYNNQSEFSWVQVRIFHENGTNLWNSPQYQDIGTFQKNWTVEIIDLNLNFNQSSIILDFQFYLFYMVLDTPITGDAIISEILVEILKRDISCQLIEFPSILKYGESLTFTARFYDTLLNSSEYLINQKIEYKIISNSICWLKKNFTINSSGIIEVYLNTSEFSYNLNYLIFSVKNNEYYNDSEFEYEIIMEVIESDIMPEVDVSPSFFPIFLFPIFLIMSLGIVLYYRNKRSKQRKLIDITIKY